MEADKTVILGIDGAHFELIKPWIKSGKLPNIECMINDGIKGDLQSVLPPVTSPNWKAYATGKNPGKLGIFWWENVDMDERRVYYPDNRKANHPEFWELIGQQSSAGVVNVPTTYPPREVEPFIVSGAPDAAETGFTHPPKLEEELKETLGYKVTKGKSIKNQPNEAAEEIVDLIDLRFKAGKYLLDEYDPEFLQISTFYINSLHHYFWDDKRTLEGWKIIDKHLKEFLNENYNIVLMSDHGATKIDTVFHINTWLEQEGYLVSDMKFTKLLDRMGISTEQLINISTKLNINDIATQATPQWIIDQIPTEGGDVRRESKTSNINWEATTALASGQGPIYVDPEKGTSEKIQTEIIKSLSTLTGPRGKSIANAIHRGQAVYNGPYLQEAPDIIIDQRDGVHIAGGLGRNQIFTNPEEDGWKGENKRDGLFVATGPDIATGEIVELSILDLAPTLLHLHGCPIPEDFDGTVRKTIYAERSNPLERNIKYSEPSNKKGQRAQSNPEYDNVRNRLQDLGYL